MDLESENYFTVIYIRSLDKFRDKNLDSSWIMTYFMPSIISNSAGPKKKQLHVDKVDDDIVGGAYDALDDYDFM